MRDVEINETLKKIKKYACLTALAAALITGCAPRSKILPDPEPEPVEAPPPPSGFVMKPFHRSMKEEMRKSYDRANEIIVGVFSGTHQDEKGGLIYYFSDFSRFDKGTLSWGSSQNVIMQVQPDKFKPEIIRRNEFKTLIDLDKTGICWDFYQGDRNVFLVEGRMNLIFLEMGFDESNNDSYRILLDAYPDTDECRARDMFNLMIQDLASSTVASPSVAVFVNPNTPIDALARKGRFYYIRETGTEFIQVFLSRGKEEYFIHAFF